MNVIDKDGIEISVGDTVNVGAPLAGDLHQHEFTGHVVDVYPEKETVCVVDQDDNVYEVDGYNVNQAA